MVKKHLKRLIPDPAEVIAWFKAKLAIMSGRQLAREMGIDPSIVNRNHKRMRKGRPLTSPFRRKIEAILEGERQEKLRQKHAEDQVAAKAEADLQAEVDLQLEAKHDAEREAKAKRKVERQGRAVGAILFAIDRAREQRRAALLAITPLLEKLRKVGILASWDEENLPGDAGELVDAGVTDFPYVSLDMVTIALAPDDHLFPCGLTAGQLRKGVTWRQRLQKTAVPQGQPRPKFIGIFPASCVYLHPLLDELWRHGPADAEVIVEWRELIWRYGYLAAGRLPLFVSPETVQGFARLIEIEETSALEFVDSCLGPDARDRLKRLRRRAVLSVVKREADGLLGDAASWYSERGWKLPLQLVFVALLAPGVVGVAYGIMEIFRLLGVGRNAAHTWLVDNGLWSVNGAIMAVLTIIIIIIAVCWVWRREGESRWPATLRFTIVVLYLSAVIMVVAGLIMGVKAVHEIIVASGGLSRGILIP